MENKLIELIEKSVNSLPLFANLETLLGSLNNKDDAFRFTNPEQMPVVYPFELKEAICSVHKQHINIWSI
jgi:hypothetical protein